MPLLSTLLLSGALAFNAVDGPAEQLRWFAGCWEMKVDGRLVEEHWMKPAGDGLMGMSRTTRGKDLTEYEFVRIARVEGTLTYLAMPVGQEPTMFKATKISDDEALFENPAHDFPRRIQYWRKGKDGLKAEISGPTRNGPRTITWNYQRAECQ